MTKEEAIKMLKTFKNHTGIPSLSEAFVIAVHALYHEIKIIEILNRDCTDITKFVLIRELYEDTETWNGIHSQITAPAGTFEKIYNEAKEDDFDV